MSISYTHLQTSPATTWSINHNLNAAPIIDVVINDAGTLKVIMPLSVVYVDANNMDITFSTAEFGEARLVGAWSYDPQLVTGTVDPGSL